LSGRGSVLLLRVVKRVEKRFRIVCDDWLLVGFVSSLSVDLR